MLHDVNDELNFDMMGVKHVVSVLPCIQSNEFLAAQQA